MLERLASAEKPPLSNIRERLLKNKLAQVELALATKEDELQYRLNSTSGLSPDKIDQRQFELGALRDLRANLLDGLETVVRSAQEIAPVDEEEDDPGYRMGGFRSQRAFFDNLQRERAKLAPLSRGSFDRAKEISAKRARFNKSGVDVSSEDVLREEHPTWFSTRGGRRGSTPGVVRKYMFAKETLTGVDPCIEYKKVRREVMFAQRSAGVGYHSKKREMPC